MCASASLQKEEEPEGQACEGPGAGMGKAQLDGDQRVTWERAREDRTLPSLIGPLRTPFFHSG